MEDAHSPFTSRPRFPLMPNKPPKPNHGLTKKSFGEQLRNISTTTIRACLGQERRRTMPKWFDTLKQQKEVERDSTTAVESADDIPADASPDHGWVLSLTIKKITARLTVNGQTY